MTTVLVTHDQEEALDVADRIAVLNHGRIEQVGSPADLYDRPENDFVMSFLGAVSTLNGVLVRPHDLRVSHIDAVGSTEAIVRRVVHLGFEVRIELNNSGDGSPLTAQVTRGEAELLGLRTGDRVFVSAEPNSGLETGPQRVPAFAKA